MWIKICGLTTREAVEAAIVSGVDAIGFVFAPSKRQVNAQQAVRLTEGIPTSVLRIAVMQHPAQSLVDEVLAVFKPDILQTDYEDLPELKIKTGHVKSVAVLPVVRTGKAVPMPLPLRLLFEGPTSGTGETADWKRAAELARQTQLVLAGGLNALNVGEAIAKVKPFGVDVSSGVESSPGVKDAKKILEFVRVVKGSMPSP